MSNYLRVLSSANRSGGGGDMTSTASISIPEAVSEDGVTYYVVRVDVDKVNWTVRHRFRDFAELHEVLVDSAVGIAKDSLPEKRRIGNRDPAFVMQRRRDLESYIQSVFQFLQRAIPPIMATFLHMDRYDVNFLLQELSAKYFDREVAPERESPVAATEESWTPLEMFAISTRLKSPLPPLDSASRRTDFTNVADQVCQMKALRLTGGWDAIGTSNVVPNELRFDFLAFKKLSKLVLLNVRCTPEHITSLGMVRRTLKHLQVNYCKLKSISAVLLCDTSHPVGGSDEDISKSFPDANVEWSSLEYLDLRHNEIARLDASLALAPSLSHLHLGGNDVARIENLAQLTWLSVLELADNNVSEAADLNAKLGQVERIDLSHNKLKSLSGFSRLYSLRHLNVAANRIKDLDSVRPVSGLPCLESLNLQGNVVTTIVDYRLKVFESFGKRCAELCLDCETPSQPEVDKVSVLMALRVAKEGKEPTALFGNLPGRVS